MVCFYFDFLGELPSNIKPNFSSSPASPKLPPFPQEPVFAPEGTTSQEVRNTSSPMMKFGEDVRFKILIF